MYADSLSDPHSVWTVAGRPQAFLFAQFILHQAQGRRMVLRREYIDGNVCLSLVKSVNWTSA